MPHKKKIEGQSITYDTCCICNKVRASIIKDGKEIFFKNSHQLAALDLSPWDGPKGLAHLPCGFAMINQLFYEPKDLPKGDK